MHEIDRRHTQQAAFNDLWGAGRSAHQATFSHLSAALANQGHPSSLVVSKREAHLQEGPKGGFLKLQACQSVLNAGEGYGADHLECHHTAHTRQPGDQAQSGLIYEQFCLTNPVFFYDKLTHLVVRERLWVLST